MLVTPEKTTVPILLVLAMLCGCVSRGLPVSDRDVPLRPGDCVLVQFVHVHPPLGEVRQVVDSAGKISLPLNIKLYVVNLTLEQLERAIAAEYWEQLPPLAVTVGRCP